MSGFVKRIIIGLFFFGSLFFLVLIVFWVFFFEEKPIVFYNNNFDNFVETDDSDEQEQIILMAVGDIMLNRGVEYMVKNQGQGDFRFAFLKIAEYTQKADILFGNLESLISNKGEKTGNIYSFRAKPEAINGLLFAGFDIVSVANNHILDYGKEAMEDCFLWLEKAGIEYVGGGFNEKQVRKGVLKEVKGTKIIFLGYTNIGSQFWQAGENSSGIGWITQEIKKDIAGAKENSDLVVVSFHFGEEYQKEQNKTQEFWAKTAIEAGADLILGHHPHVIQPVEKYKSGWIAYSLGNFIFDQYFSEETMQGIILEVIIENKKITQVKPVKFKISEFYQPYLVLLF